MKTLFVFFVAVLMVGSTFSQVSGNIESQNLIVSGKSTVPQINIYLRESILLPGLSWTAWALIKKDWSESYVGLIYSPTPEFEVSASFGLETDNNPQRFGWSTWIGRCGFSALSIYEQGGSGFWFKHIVKYKYESAGIGIHYQRFKGFGPYGEITIERKFTLWASCLLNEPVNNVFAGIKLLF